MAQAYEFAVSLRIWHPSISTESITRKLRLRPSLTKTAGRRRRTPLGAPLRSADGRLLGGANRESYWVADIIRPGVRSTGRQASAERHIERICRRLRRHAEFFRRIRREGGDVRIWVDSHSRRNYAFELTPACLEVLAAAAVALVIDVYPYPQNW
jgi:hypothetical protein